jgi:ABC-type glycerol-3-phosphate transport system substrate-binding protein
MKKILLLPVLAVILLLLNACGLIFPPEPTPEATPSPIEATAPPVEATGEEPVDEPITEAPVTDLLVSYMTWDSNTELSDLFIKEYGGEIDWIIVDWDTYMEVFISRLTAGQSPDVVEIQEGMQRLLIGNGYLQPLDGLLDLNMPHWQAIANNPIHMKDGKNYALAGDSSIWYQFFYNKDIFSESGIETPSILFNRGEWTWEKMFETAGQLKQDGFWGLSAEEVHIPLMAVFAANELGFIGQNTDGSYYNNTNSPRITYLLNQFHEAASIQAYLYTGSDGADVFARGEAAMFHGGYWHFFDGALNEMLVTNQVGMLPPPSVGGAADEARMGNLFSVSGIPVNAKNPEAAALVIDLQRRYILSKTGLSSHYMSDYGFNSDQIKYVYDIPAIPYTDLYFDFEWWNPFYNVANGTKWESIRESVRIDVQLAVDRMNGR